MVAIKIKRLPTTQEVRNVVRRSAESMHLQLSGLSWTDSPRKSREYNDGTRYVGFRILNYQTLEQATQVAKIANFLLFAMGLEGNVRAVQTLSNANMIHSERIYLRATATLA